MAANTSALDQYGRTLLAIGNIEAACTRIEENGETFVTSAIIELGGGTFGIAQAASATRDRWMVSDGQGWLDAEFATILDAVEALHNPKTRAAMRQQTDLRWELNELQQRVRALPPSPNALPTA